MQTTGRREQTKVANRAAILDAARDVFAEMGFGAASVRDIVRRTALASGTFYNYFPDKESVLRALVEEAAGEVRVVVRDARQASRTLEDFVSSGFRAYFSYLQSDPQLFELMSRNAGTIRVMFDQPAVGAGTDELAEDIRARIAAGIVPPIDPDYMAHAMVGAAFEIAVSMLDRDPVDIDGAVDFVSAIFLGGIQRMA